MAPCGAARRRCAAEALGQIGDPRAVTPLLGVLANDTCLVRIAAAQAAQALADAIVANPASTPVVGKTGFVACTAGQAGCDRNDLPNRQLCSYLHGGGPNLDQLRDDLVPTRTRLAVGGLVLAQVAKVHEGIETRIALEVNAAAAAAIAAR